jgi:hypothetical protein
MQGTVFDLFSQMERPCFKPEESISVILRAINSQNNGGLLDYVGIATDITSGKVDRVTGERLINVPR